MESRGKSPRGSENKNHWHTDKLKPGETFEGWIAGPGVCVCMHDSLPTKPCLKRYLGFDVPCPGCASRIKLVDLIFVPVYRDVVAKKVVVPLRFAAARLVDPMPLHHCVIVSRPKSRNEARQVVSRPKQMIFKPPECMQMPADISEWLPVLWGYGERLTGAHLLRGPVFDVPSSTAAAVLDQQSEAEALAGLEARAEEQRRARLRGKTPGETLANVGRDVFRENPALRSAERNGTGKHD